MDIEAVDVVDVIDERIFQRILDKGEPVKIKNCSFGPCLKNWTLDHLSKVLGEEDVVIHESNDTDLNFLDKNFTYRSCKFSDFANQLADSKSPKSVYLRSTNKNPRAKKQARIEDDFPTIKDDLCPPSFIPYGQQNPLYHSSVLRIASHGVRIWTHFDLYDNILCQVVGAKRILLFPPQDSRYLYVEGDKSRLNNFDDWQRCREDFPLVIKTNPRACFLEPGDCIYIPSLWWHNIKSLRLVDGTNIYPGYSIGFNIFWKDERLTIGSQYAESDVYGNKNLPLFDAALSNLEKAIQHLNKLPPKYCEFYKIMLLQQLRKKLSLED